MTAANRPTRLLVITDDVLGVKMAGPAIRAVEIAREIALSHDVTLVSTVGGSVEIPSVKCAPDGSDLRPLVESADVVLLQGAVMVRHPWLRDQPVKIVVDLYDPFHLEALQLEHDDQLRALDDIEGTLATLADQMTRGDFFICASDRQRAMWIGHLASLGRINPLSRASDPTLRSLIDVVPFGINPEPPSRSGPGFRHLFPAITDSDPVLLWGGGIYDWFDPITLQKAVIKASESIPNLRLVFLAGPHPNPDVPTMKVTRSARDSAALLDPDEVHIFFVDEWVPYNQRQNYLLDATIGVTIHRESIEASFSFRTRVLDYLWAGLPVIATRGDSLADRIAESGAGRVVESGDVDSVAAAIVDICSSEASLQAATAGARKLANEYIWEKATAPLRRFVDDPHRAKDLSDPMTKGFIDQHRPPSRSGFAHLLRRSRRNLAAGGVTRFMSATVRHLARRLRIRR